MFDGYIITEDHATAIEAFNEDSVRHAAVLDTGEGFVAFVGDRFPCAGRPLFNDPTQEGEFVKVRHHGPLAHVRHHGPQMSDEPETFVLMTMDHFLALNPICVRMASVLTDGNVLAITLPDSVPADAAIWSANAEWFLDKRLALV